ncbi:hypothetical protein L0128_15870 [candidate division KSB1 bacterium]|nr:hypothetical protein [candidate division KSB1 bacterium]
MLAKKFFFGILNLILLGGFGCFINSCDMGVEPSPAPGVLRVTLQADPADSTILIVKDWFTVKYGDFFLVTIFQGKAFNDSNYAVLFVDKSSYQEKQSLFNMIEKKENTFERYVIFESYLPPFEYDRIQFGITALVVSLGNLEIPIQSPPNTTPFVTLPQNFKIMENRVTEINLQLSPFKSVKRYRDSYHFIPQMQIIDVKYY